MHAGFLLNGQRNGVMLRCLLIILLWAGWICAGAQAAEPVNTSASSRFIALILPSKSKALKPAAEAIKAGVLAADKAHGGAASIPVRIYDTADAEEETLSMFNLAKSQGAVAVIGPLTRGAMNYLADNGDMSIPVLALNSFDEMTLRRNNLYSFGLSIDSEVQQVVRLMRSQQVTTPLVLMSEGPLSTRMQRAFVEAWRQETGNEPAVMEVRDARSQVLELKAKAGESDGIFFAADGRRAAQIRPYLPADRICYATSQVLVGRAVPVDLSGVRYLEIPWLANPDLPDYAVYGRVRAGSADVERLFALGVDAWQLAQQLANGQAMQPQDGLTGKLSEGKDGVINRELLSRVATTRGVPPAEMLNPANAGAPAR